MIWLRAKSGRIQPALDSIRHTFSQQQRRADTQQDIQSHKINWKSVGCAISLAIFTVLLFGSIIGIPVVLTQLKTSPKTTNSQRALASKQLCTTRASWSSKGITVAGLSNNLPSTALSGLHHPSDIYVYANGTLLIADTDNNRIVKWNRNAKEGVLIAGTGSYGSWNNLLAKPTALTVYHDHLYVSDSDNYRIQVFTLNSNSTSPRAVTLIGRYGQGSQLNQINEVKSLAATASLLFMADSNNDRILSWNFESNFFDTVLENKNMSKSNSTTLHHPSGLAYDPKTSSLYVADTSHSRIQKYSINNKNVSNTVAGWGELNRPTAVQLDPSGTNMFIVDTLNHRVLLWLEGSRYGRTIIGNGTAGNSDEQLNSPSQIRFDADYNLYVVDTNNCRVQRFDLISNGCEKYI
ncbi:unnamed protein product [Adineta ricciae]|uniref:Uncharacterized protein n=1 Tax=Adineta ricciae TaxID=249248 RepID=A0A814USP8_ADIRI|nr:unnamed protein product [Adineta ricciae]